MKCDWWTDSLTDKLTPCKLYTKGLIRSKRKVPRDFRKKRKRKRSDSVLWQKPLHQQKCQKGKVTTQTTPQKSSIKQRADRLRTKFKSPETWQDEGINTWSGYITYLIYYLTLHIHSVIENVSNSLWYFRLPGHIERSQGYDRQSSLL